MLPQFRLGLGGRMGSGRQYWPCIALADWLDAVEFLLARNDLSGPVNLVGPTPVTNAAFVAALGTVTHRPTLLPAPAPLLRLVLGGFASELLDSRRVVPAVLTRAGFTFGHPDLESALRAALAPRQTGATAGTGGSPSDPG
jgi:NAD dependent epimerase/dehydratase family enzyme